MDRVPTFPEIMQARARSQAHQTACRFFSGPELKPATLSFLELWQQSAALARILVAAGLSGQRILLVCRSQQRFVVAFYACLVAGVVAVPTAGAKRTQLLDRLRLIAVDAEIAAVAFDVDEIAQWEPILAGVRKFDLRELDRAAIASVEAHASMFARAQPDQAAFLQYTSGSTGDPKGVIVTHRNLVQNSAVIADAMEISAASSLFTALPLYHDMGLVGGVLQLMYSGCVAGFLPPAEFVQYPERWLQIISRYGVTVSGGPNFMYDLAARTIKDRELDGVELSAWRVAFCGAEPIRAGTVRRFVDRFGAVGFRADAFYPCYGMAESTLFISGVNVGAPLAVQQRETGAVVGCGRPRLDMSLEIVDPATRKPVAPGDIGEIWVAGSSVAPGYWRRPQLTASVFHATLAASDEAKFLRTGDLGLWQDEQLYVVGRLKDLVIVHGKKYAPQDIEAACESAHEGLRRAAGAAFSVEHDDTERLVVVHELERSWLRRSAEWSQIRQAVRLQLSQQFGLPLFDLVLIRPGALPRTSSGKVRRGQCRSDYQNERLAVAVAPRAAERHAESAVRS